MEDFYKRLESERHRETYARITSLQWDESPIEYIEGRISQGSINIDGTSAVRRSCSLTLIAQNVDISDYAWALKSKFKLEIGLKNNIDANYPEVIWFNQGIYVITSFNCAVSTNNYTISIQGKDKMCLLNGEIGGTLTAQTQFDSYEQELYDGSWSIIKYPIKQIIRDAVHQYANEPLYNIVINDVDDEALELLEYRYDTPMYLIRRKGESQYINGTLDGAMPCWKTVSIDDKGNYQKINESSTTIAELDKYDALINDIPGEVVVLEEAGAEIQVQIARIEYGDTPGYRITDMTYPDDLILKVGEALTSMLDKIKTMLGDFEYFYDVNGTFIFQRQKTWTQQSFSPIKTTDENTSYVDTEINSYVYRFQGGELISAFTNTPKLSDVKNDFSVWGVRDSSAGDGDGVPIHYRYAIDKKPTKYISPYQFDADNNNIAYDSKTYPWQELIYQMQADYRKHNRDDDFYIQIAKFNEEYPNGITGYEQYYIDVEGFWRQIYYPLSALEQKEAELEKQINEMSKGLSGMSEAAQKKQQQRIDALTTEQKNAETYWKADYDDNGYSYISQTDPALLNFKFDFFDTTGQLENFSNKVIGNRPKVVNDSKIKAIQFRSTPTIIFISSSESNINERLKTGYRYFQSPEMDMMFSVSAQGRSAEEEIQSLVYNYAYAKESVNITTIPIYRLEPNVRIYISYPEIGIEGEYIATKYSIPLAYNGTMNIIATKAPEEII